MLAKKMGDVAKKYKAPDVEHYAAELVGEMFKSRLAFQGYVTPLLNTGLPIAFDCFFIKQTNS